MFPPSALRGKGPLKNTSDVISAAKKIAEAGSRMDKLGRTIADQVSLTRSPPPHQSALYLTPYLLSQTLNNPPPRYMETSSIIHGLIFQ